MPLVFPAIPEIPRGSFVLVTGTTGSGKTSFVRQVTEPEDDCLILSGENSFNWVRPDRRQYHRQVGTPSDVANTVGEFIRAGRSLRMVVIDDLNLVCQSRAIQVAALIAQGSEMAWRLVSDLRGRVDLFETTMIVTWQIPREISDNLRGATPVGPAHLRFNADLILNLQGGEVVVTKNRSGFAPNRLQPARPWWERLDLDLC